MAWDDKLLCFKKCKLQLCKGVATEESMNKDNKLWPARGATLATLQICWPHAHTSNATQLNYT